MGSLTLKWDCNCLTEKIKLTWILPYTCTGLPMGDSNMQILKAMLLGLIQGFSEFFPISSSGNIYFYSNLLNTCACTISFDILVHCAALIALLFVYYRDLIHIFKSRLSHFNKMLMISCVPFLCCFGFWAAQ